MVNVKRTLKRWVDKHLEVLLDITSLFFNCECDVKVMVIGWLKRWKCFTLGILLSASRRALLMDSHQERPDDVEKFMSPLVDLSSFWSMINFVNGRRAWFMC
jgi:hypothetical protein